MPPPTATAVLTPAELEQIGRALYGEQWQTPLSRDLDISDRSVRYLADGTRPVHEGLARDLLRVVAARGVELTQLTRLIADKVGDGMQRSVGEPKPR